VDTPSPVAAAVDGEGVHVLESATVARRLPPRRRHRRPELRPAARQRHDYDKGDTVRQITSAFAAGVCVMVMTAAPALAEPGNTATDSTGVVQIGSVNAAPTVGASGSGGSASATAPSGTGANQNGGNNTASRSTGAVQSSPAAVNPNVSTRTGGITARAAAPVAIGSGDNNASSSTGAVQVGGGNTASGSTGAAQVSGVQSSPAASAAPPAGDPVSVGGPIGIDGSGNSADGSTGTLQVGGGNSAAGSQGSVQSGGPELAPTVDTGGFTVLSTLLEPTALSGILAAPPSQAAGAAVAAVTAAENGSPTVTGQSRAAQSPRLAALGRPGGSTVAAATRSLAQRIVAGTLPFTGLGLLVWVILGAAAVVAGASLRRRGARLA
jgi:hypothetical protein